MTPEKMLRFRNRQRLLSKLFAIACWMCTCICILVLAGILIDILIKGIAWVNWRFLTNLSSADPHKSGILPGLVSSILLLLFTAIFSVPIGVGTALYLEEYVRPCRWRSIVQLNIANLAGVPSIVYGLLGLGIFYRALHFGDSLITGALTLSLVILPIVILASQEALRSVPDSIRHASYALGATRWQTVRHQVLPAATPGIMTGVILSLSRAIGEAAPLIAVGAVLTMSFVPVHPLDPYSALPIQIYGWCQEPKADFQHVTAAGIIVLMTLLISMNAVAVFVRYRFSKRIRW